jgi:hypothetical protein
MLDLHEPAPGYVEQGNAAFLSGFIGVGLDLDKDLVIVPVQESHLAGNRTLSGKNTGKEWGKELTGCCLDKLLEAQADQSGTLVSQKGGTGEIHRTDGAGGIEGKVTDRCELVQVTVAFQCGLRILPCLAKLDILQLQLDLVELQLLQEPSGIIIGPVPGQMSFSVSDNLLCPVPQRGRARCRLLYGFHAPTSFHKEFHLFI